MNEFSRRFCLISARFWYRMQLYWNELSKTVKCSTGIQGDLFHNTRMSLGRAWRAIIISFCFHARTILVNLGFYRLRYKRWTEWVYNSFPQHLGNTINRCTWKKNVNERRVLIGEFNLGTRQSILGRQSCPPTAR